MAPSLPGQRPESKLQIKIPSSFTASRQKLTSPLSNDQQLKITKVEVSKMKVSESSAQILTYTKNGHPPVNSQLKMRNNPSSQANMKPAENRLLI